MSQRPTLGNAVRYLKNEGLRRFWFKALRDSGIYCRYYFLSADLGENVGVSARIPLTFRPLDEREIESILRWRRSFMHEYLREWYRKGFPCYGAWHGRDVTGVCWVRTDRVVMRGIDLNAALERGVAYFFDAFTHPHYRGKSIQPALCAHICSELVPQGFTMGLRATLPDNRSALRAHAKAGFFPYALAGRIAVGPVKRYFVHRFERWAGRNAPLAPAFPGPRHFGKRPGTFAS